MQTHQANSDDQNVLKLLAIRSPGYDNDSRLQRYK